jgi:uncharacterized protein YacL (UPF0231 family)
MIVRMNERRMETEKKMDLGMAYISEESTPVGYL